MLAQADVGAPEVPDQAVPAPLGEAPEGGGARGNDAGGEDAEEEGGEKHRRGKRHSDAQLEIVKKAYLEEKLGYRSIVKKYPIRIHKPHTLPRTLTHTQVRERYRRQLVLVKQ